MLAKVFKILLGSVLVIVAIIGLIYAFTMPEAVDPDSSSAAWLKAGPYAVGSVDRTFVDEARPTPENKGAAEKPHRTLESTLWFPKGGEGNYPLIVHSHGFTSSRADVSYVAESLASYGYVVVAADYPLTSGGAAGGPNADDTINQPGDISFLIDSVLNLSGNDKPFDAEIDSSRIGAMGYSLGGLTTSLVTYHSRLRDPRIKAAVSMAGLTAPLQRNFYGSSNIPFLMVAGSLDALVNYDAHGAVVAERIANSQLVRIDGGTHLGFTTIAEPLLRLMNHPDGLGCAAVLANLDGGIDSATEALGTPDEGVYLDPSVPDVCDSMPTEKAVHPGRQQMVTQIAVLAFFESIFNDDAQRRQEAQLQLSENLSREFVEASYISSTR